jgi:hypothetical protein
MIDTQQVQEINDMQRVIIRYNVVSRNEPIPDSQIVSTYLLC